jgi:hypothetical protein
VDGGEKPPGHRDLADTVTLPLFSINRRHTRERCRAFLPTVLRTAD